jgi:DNA-binding XRE family transcriptional regulator
MAPDDLLISNDEVLAQELQDPEFRQEWKKTTVARWLATELAHYRAEHDLTQRALADHLGVHQSDVARMEGGRVAPTLEKLINVAQGLGMEIMIDIHPEGREAQLPKKRAKRRSAVAYDGVEVVMATA